jgi:hypothetical protein
MFIIVAIFFILFHRQQYICKYQTNSFTVNFQHKFKKFTLLSYFFLLRIKAVHTKYVFRFIVESNIKKHNKLVLKFNIICMLYVVY